MIAPASTASPNGKRSSAPRHVARNVSELMHDVLTLSELQLRLARADFQQLRSGMILPVALLLVGAVILLSCLPIALATIALTIHIAAGFNLAASFAFTLAGGLVIGGIAALAAVYWIRSRWRPFERSLVELDQNVRWLKRMLKASSGPRRELAEADD